MAGSFAKGACNLAICHSNILLNMDQLNAPDKIAKFCVLLETFFSSSDIVVPNCQSEGPLNNLQEQLHKQTKYFIWSNYKTCIAVCLIKSKLDITGPHLGAVAKKQKAMQSYSFVVHGFTQTECLHTHTHTHTHTPSPQGV